MSRVTPIPSPEDSDLERRVLAQERILQALIAFMARTEPRFIDHLKERFVEPMRFARHEHDHRETDDYAEEFIRAVLSLGELHVPAPNKSTATDEHPDYSNHGEHRDHSLGQQGSGDRIQVRDRNGIWEVRVDGKFHGDYHQKENALAAASRVKLLPQ